MTDTAAHRTARRRQDRPDAPAHAQAHVRDDDARREEAMTAERSDDLERLRPAMFCRECGYLGLAVAGHGCPGDESPQDVTYQEAILDGADPMDGFYGD